MAKQKIKRAAPVKTPKVQVPEQWAPTESRHFIVRSITWWDIDPTDAAYILKQSETLQHRPIDIRAARQYAEDMTKGRWRTDETSPLVIDDDVRCWDGRTRLQAIIIAGKIMKMPVEAVPKGTSGIDYLKTRNIGRPLKFSDLLRLQGEKNVNHLAAALRLVYDYELNGDVLRGAHSFKMSNGAGEELLQKHPGIRDSVSFCNGAIGRILAFRTAISFSHYIIGKINEKRRDQFFSSLETGTSLLDKNPILQLRNRFLKERRDPSHRIETIESVALIFKAWNAWIADERVSLLVWKLNEPFPVLRKPGNR